MKKQKIGITLDKELVPIIDELRTEQGHSRSSFINYVLNKFIKEEKDKAKA
jgi:metal-responsive CopG/Arc/MetJ family transcriptional regulator